MRITDRDTGLKLSRVQVSLTPSELRWLIGLLQQHCGDAEDLPQDDKSKFVIDLYGGKRE
jgi:hypothetical protein